MIFTGSKIFQNFYLEEENNNALCEIIENMILAICPIMIEVLSAIEMEDFKQFIVSEETTNQ